MKSAFWVALSLTALAFAGCTEEPDPLTEDDCKVQGLILDPGVEYVDNETGETYLAPGCVEDIPSVTVSMSGAPETSVAWTPINLTWTLHTTLEEDHSHNNGIRVSKESNPSYVGKVDGYGKGLLGGNEEHRNFVEGDSSTVEWVPEEPGTYYVRAYAVSAWGNFWAPEHTVEITEVTASGENTDVALSGGGLQGVSSIDPTDAQINLGSTITWTTSDPGVTWLVSRTKGPALAERFTDIEVDAPYLFKVPGYYEYTAKSFAPDGTEIGSVAGTITVASP